jgi:hypothetical protein
MHLDSPGGIFLDLELAHRIGAAFKVYQGTDKRSEGCHNYVGIRLRYMQGHMKYW